MFKRRQIERDEKLRRDFLPEALEIIEKPASPLGHTIIWIIIVVVIAFIVWSSVSRIDENATATGKIVTAMGVQTVQSEVNGTVKAITTKEGDTVHKGQILLELNTDTNEDTLAYYQSTKDIAALKIKLLKKLLKDENITFKQSSKSTEEERDVLEYIRSIKQEKETELSEFDRKIDEQQASIEEEKGSLDVLKVQLQSLCKKRTNLKRKLKRRTSQEEQLRVLNNRKESLLKKQKEYQSLFEAEIVTKADLEQIENQLEEIEGNISVQETIVENNKADIGDSISDIELSIMETKEQIEAKNVAIAEKENTIYKSREAKKGIGIKYNAQVKSQIVEQQAQLKQANISISQYEKQIKSSTIVSPCDGVIKTMAVNTIGAVVPQATALIEIVPDNSELIMEANVNTSDIGYIKQDQEVKIKLSTFDYQEFGLLKGRVNYVGNDSQVLQNGKEIYKIKIVIDSEAFLEKNPSVALKTGMEGTVEIKIGSRRVIDFFLEPLTKQFDESLTVR